MATLIRKYLSKFRYSVWFLEGAERHSNADLRMLYVGGSEVNKNYIANLAFRPAVHERFLGRFWMLRPTRFKHELAAETDMVVTEIKKGFMDGSDKSCFFVPCWIDGRINIDETLHLTETIEKIKCDLRRVRKSQYAHQVSHERKEFIDFYNHMYVPHTTKNYGNEATLHSLEGILKKFEWSELLLIKDGEKPIAGEVIEYQSNGPKLLCLGVLNGDRRYVNAGAIAALFYFRLMHLKNKGYTEIDFGASRGFWNDGVLRYKRKWGLNLTATRGGGFLIHQLNLNRGTKAFLENNPFIISEPDGLSSVCFFDDKRTMTQKEQKRILSTVNAPGIKKLLVYQMDGHSPTLPFSENTPLPVEVRRINPTGQENGSGLLRLESAELNNNR